MNLGRIVPTLCLLELGFLDDGMWGEGCGAEFLESLEMAFIEKFCIIM